MTEQVSRKRFEDLKAIKCMDRDLDQHETGEIIAYAEAEHAAREAAERERNGRFSEFLAELLPGGGDGDPESLPTEVQNYVQRLKRERDEFKAALIRMQDRAEAAERKLSVAMIEGHGLRGERDALQDTIERVRAIHVPDDEGGTQYCEAEGHLWPCGTLRALDSQP